MLSLRRKARLRGLAESWPRIDPAIFENWIMASARLLQPFMAEGIRKEKGQLPYETEQDAGRASQAVRCARKSCANARGAFHYTAFAAESPRPKGLSAYHRSADALDA